MAYNTKVGAGDATVSFEPPMAQIEDDLRAIGKDLSNMRTPLTTAIKTVIIPSIDAQFQAGGDPAWEPLSPETINRRDRQGTGEKILVETGALQRVATQFSRWDVGTDQAEISNFPAYRQVVAAVHQNGAERVGGSHGVSIPARPFMVISSEDQDKITDVFYAWMSVRAGAHWGGPGSS